MAELQPSKLHLPYRAVVHAEEEDTHNQASRPHAQSCTTR
jgi:hypothetical protein